MREAGKVWPWIIGAGVLWLITRRGAAAPRSGVGTPGPVGPTTTTGPGGPARIGGGGMDARRVLDTYGPILHLYNGPMPPAALAVVIARESGGNPHATARGGKFDEVGLTQLVVTHSPADRRGEGEAKLSDVDPWDAASNVYGAQVEYNRVKQALLNWFPDNSYTPHPDRDVAAWLTLLQLCRSVGLGGTKQLLSAAVGLGHFPLDALRSLHDSHTNLIPSLGVQTPALVRTRLKRALDFPEACRFAGPLPDALEALPPRGPEVVAFPAHGDPPEFMVRLGRA